MQKRGIAATALYAITIIEFNLKNQKQDIILANIEALAQTEFDYNNGAERRIMDSFQSEPIYQVDINGNKLLWQRYNRMRI